MTTILAIDPGSERSGWLEYDTAKSAVRTFGKDPNLQLRGLLDAGLHTADVVVIEWVRPRGMLASEQLFETLWWAGRFTEVARPSRVERLERSDVKRHLLGTTKGTDSQVRAALIDRFGGIGGKEVAIGRKASQGPLYGIAADVWAALAVAVTYADQLELER